MDYPMFISVGDWLDSIKMSQYKSNFMAAGYNTLDSVARMSIEWVDKPKHNHYYMPWSQGGAAFTATMLCWFYYYIKHYSHCWRSVWRKSPRRTVWSCNWWHHHESHGDVISYSFRLCFEILCLSKTSILLNGWSTFWIIQIKVDSNDSVVFQWVRVDLYEDEEFQHTVSIKDRILCS